MIEKKYQYLMEQTTPLFLIAMNLPNLYKSNLPWTNQNCIWEKLVNATNYYGAILTPSTFILSFPQKGLDPKVFRISTNFL
jgi:hypothetical protein